MFLTPEEIHDLTGYRQPARQIEMLKKQGIPFHVNAAGHPKVARAIIEGRSKEKRITSTWTPSWAATQP